MSQKNPDSSPASEYLGEELPGLHYKYTHIHGIKQAILRKSFLHEENGTIFPNESICWNLSRIEEIHAEILKVIGWMNCNLPEWVKTHERFENVCAEIRESMEWNS